MRAIHDLTGRMRTFLSTLALVLRESLVSFQRNHAPETAATLSFYGLLAMIPLSLLAVILLSRFLLASEVALSVVGEFSTRWMPELGEAVVREVQALSSQRNWTLLSLFVLLGLVMPFASTCRAALGRLIVSRSPPTFLREKLRDGVGTLLVLALFMGATLVGLLRSRLTVWMGFEGGPGEPFLGAFSTAGLLGFGLFIFYAGFMPARIRFSHLAAGVLTAGVLLVALQPAFSAFLRFNPNYGFAFGSLKAVFVLIMWGYWNFCALLFGAEVIANARRRDAVFLRNLLNASGSAASSRLVRKFLRSFDVGEVVFREDEPGQVMYMIRAGEALLFRSGRRLQALGAGDFFGEMSMLLDAPRSATVKAGGNGLELIEITRENFDQILHENPRVVESMLRRMAQRLYRANERLVEYSRRSEAGGGIPPSNCAEAAEEGSEQETDTKRNKPP